MENEKENQLAILSSEEIMSLTRQKNIAAKGASELFMAAFGFNKLNSLYQKLSDKSGYEFIEAVLSNLEIQYSVDPEDFENIPRKGAFIIISNHPFGGLEGLILLKEILKYRSDFKILGNYMLRRIEQLQEYIFAVDPFESSGKNKTNISGMKAAFKHLENGSPLLIFPAGEVSSLNLNTNEVSDRKWMMPAIKFIKKAAVPVLPVYFHGANSIWFHSLGLIHPLLRTAKIPSELLNKKNKLIKVQKGKMIPVNDQNEYSDINKYGRYLRAKTYMLNSSFEIKKFFNAGFNFPVIPEDITPPINVDILCNEINNLPEKYLLIKQQNFTVYYAPYALIPNILRELGRLREITFREIGEGTNKRIDLDEYDLYYNHLFIWDNHSKTIVGAYRIGMGKDIMRQYGAKGFYIKSLFKTKKGFKVVLEDSLELGRSFVTKEFQRNPLSLFLLWKGILQFLVRNPDYRYLIGPVSISNRYSNVLRTLIVKYIEENHFNGYLAQFVKPKKKFRVPEIGSDTYVLTENIRDLKELDTVIRDMDPNSCRLPVLLKKYLELNGKIICFNLDPKFNDALDGLLVLDLYSVPVDSIRMLSKELNGIELMKRFNLKQPFNINQFGFESIAQL